MVVVGLLFVESGIQRNNAVDCIVFSDCICGGCSQLVATIDSNVPAVPGTACFCSIISRPDLRR